MKNEILNIKAIKSRKDLIESLKLAISEADKLNKLLDDMHDMLHLNNARKAA